ncbi:MAG: hypothetical protein N4A49_16180 [Marinifilaceae bacterium]|nr:hypothetical protein [Marinifilaceae bacterium]
MTKISFAIILSIILSFLACSSDTNNAHPVPFRHINITLELDFYSELNVQGNYIYINEYAGSGLGYANHGIIVVNVGGGFKCFDASCPLDFNEEQALETEEGFAHCSICDSKFNILDSGYPFNDSAARHKLKEYKTAYNKTTNRLRIFN